MWGDVGRYTHLYDAAALVEGAAEQGPLARGREACGDVEGRLLLRSGCAWAERRQGGARVSDEAARWRACGRRGGKVERV